MCLPHREQPRQSNPCKLHLFSLSRNLRKISQVVLATFWVINLGAQVPTISSFAPLSGAPGTSVVITGTNFNTTLANNTVWFGGSRATVTAASTTLLTVSVPVGSAHGPVRVLANGRQAESPLLFTPTFQNGTLTESDFESNVNFTTGQAWNIKVADIDNDARPDVAVANASGNSFSVLRNNSSTGVLNSSSFVNRVDFITGDLAQSLTIIDIDGDGKLDIVVSNFNDNTISIYRNTSTVGQINSSTFEAKVDFAVGINPGPIAAADIDGDGRIDLAIGNMNGNSISILRNVSTPGVIGTSSFDPQSTIAGLQGPFDAALSDIDEDSKPELIVVNNSGSLYIFRNVSVPGNVSAGSFLSPVSFVTDSDPYSAAIGDIDRDNKLDIVVSNRGNGTGTSISVFKNQSSPGSITASSLAARVNFTTSTSPWEVELSDMNGDGRLDIVVPTNDGISILKNIGSDGVINGSTFSTNVDLVGNGTAVALNDLNGNGKPEIIVNSGNSIAVYNNIVTPFAPEPTAHPTSMFFTNQASTSFTVNFTTASGLPDGYIAFMKEGASPSFVPVDGTVYPFNEQPDPVGDPGNYTVLNDVYTSFGIVSVTPGATLYFDVYSYNGSGSGINYRTSSLPLEGSFTTPLPAAEPTSQAKDLIITLPFANTFKLDWTNGNGSNRLVVGRQEGSVDQAPIDGVTYIGTASFSVGDDLGGGNYVVYNGSGNTVTVIDIDATKAYQFFVFEYNGSPGLENYLIATASNNPKTYDGIVDTTPPVAGANSTPSSVLSGANIDVSAQFSDPESGVASVTLGYRSLTAGVGFTSISMTLVGQNWQAQIPSSALGELGAEYTMTAINGAGGSLEIPFKQVRVISLNGVNISFPSFGGEQKNYRIISVPLVLTDKKISTVFEELGPYDGIKWRMFRYINETNTEINPTTSTIEPGLGYWLIIRTDPGTINTGEGTTVPATTDQPFSIPLVEGWNQIGNPYNFNLVWSDVQAENSGLPSLTTYNGNWVSNSTRLDKLTGGFIKLGAGQSMDLMFPVVKNTASGGRKADSEPSNALDQMNWKVPITLTHGEQVNQLGGIGMNEKAANGFDVLDQFTLPRFFEAYLEFNHHKKDGNDYYAFDMIPPTNDHIWEVSVSSTGTEPLMSFSWDNSYFGNNDRELYWMDVGTGRSINMRNVNRYVFYKDESGPFKIIYGSLEFVKENTKVSRVILHGIHPIPADEQVTISFSLPEPDKTTASIELMDAMGQRMWKNVSEFGPGYNEVQWHRNGEASGIYFAIIKTGNSIHTKRFILR